MSHRRQPDRDVVHPHPHALVTHPPLPPPPHLNGNSTVPPSTPGSISNGSNHTNTASAQLVSPTVVPSTAPPPNGVPTSTIHKLALANEQTWLLIGRVAEQMGDLEHAITAYENALRHNPLSLSGLTQVAGIARIKENYPKAIEYFQRVLQLQEDNGEVWSALGHCYLMQDDLQKAYSAYQQALYLLPNPKEDPKLWYGIGILYDRYGSLDHAEEAFASVLKMDKELDFDKANEILFRLGIIYKQQGKYDDSLGCFDRILRNPPSPLAHADIWFQIGHVYEQQNEYARAKDAYERVVADNPVHAKVLQQLGWLYHQEGSSFQNQELAIQFLTKSLEADSSDAQSWYLLGRAYMAGQKYNKAYEAYQQAVYRDGRNPTFWCSIGVLYFQINQFRDALDAYSRAIRINPYISEVWFDLGSLYESCNNQISDAIDAYARAAELDPGNVVISQRLQLLKNAQATGGQLPAAPGPQDVHPNAYANQSTLPPGLSGPPLLLQSTSTRPLLRSDSRGPGNNDNLHLPPPPVPVSRASPPFRGPPPPVSIDESRHPPSHTPLAPMDVDRPHHRDFSGPSRDSVARGPTGHPCLLLHHPVPQQQLPTEELRSSTNQDLAQHSEYFNRPLRVPSGSASPAPHPARPRSPVSTFPAYPPPSRQPIGPAQPSIPASQRTPPSYPRELRAADRDMAWDRRGPHPEHHRDWEDRDHRGRSEYPTHPSQQPYYASRSPGPRRALSPMETSPRSAHHSRPHWDSKPPGGPSHQPLGPPESGHWRYDPARFDARERPVERDVESRRHSSSVVNSPEAVPRVPLHTNVRMSVSPEPSSADSKNRRKQPQPTKDKDSDTQSIGGSIPSDAPKRKKRQRRAKDDSGLPANLPASFKVPSFSAKDGQDTASSSGSGNRSLQPSPTGATPRLPSRVVDEDYDEGVADALVNLSQTRPAEQSASAHDNYNATMHSPTLSNASRHTANSPRDAAPHRRSTSSSNGPSPASSGASSLKRPLSPPTEETDSKRTRVESVKRGSGSSSGRHTPVPSRSSPSFRMPPASHSPDSHPHNETALSTFPSPPKIAVPFPPHPRPIGAAVMALPPIATLSSSSTPSPTDDRMAVDRRSITPPSRGKLSEVMNPAVDSPGARPVASSPRAHEKKDSPSSA
ncbi:TPR-like protein [Pisolithus orientalis]|uniref:TPR-like protein n=1 Tax=Pisolithus orientalis TaxID=936130 RepID=UPI00222474E1|nr:TPR-like protein [Pisolithus orientalis]KAI5991298.1 TPR-like protein [Pisolithus orientalis]